MSQVLVVRPGATALDEQERMKGSLDIPLSEVGKQQVLLAIDQISKYPIAICKLLVADISFLLL